MREEASIFFGAIASRTGDFYRRYRKAESYARLSKEAVLAAFDEFFAPGAPSRRKLTVRVASQRHAREAKAAAAGGQGEGAGDAGAGAGAGRNEGEGEEGGSAVVLRSLEDVRAFKARTPKYK